MSFKTLLSLWTIVIPSALSAQDNCTEPRDAAVHAEIFTAITPYFEATRGEDPLADNIALYRELHDFEYRVCQQRYIFSFVASKSMMEKAALDDTVAYISDFDVHLFLDADLIITDIAFGTHKFTWQRFLSED